MVVDDKMIARINELARKKKSEGLTEAEAAEQAQLRAAYIAAFRESTRQTIESVRLQRPDGTIEALKKKDDGKLKQ